MAEIQDLIVQGKYDKNFQKDVAEDIKSGNINRLSEYLKLVDGDSPEVVKFQNYMESLTKKILPGWDFKKNPVQFYISEMDEKNAGLVDVAKSPLIFFTKDLLNTAEGLENKILYVLGHELGHELFGRALGKVRITKPEEIVVSIPVIQWMYENNINPQPAVQFVQQISPGQETAEEESVMSEIITAIVDEHLTPAFDVNIVNDTLVAYRNLVAGDFSTCQLIAVPDEMQEIFKNAKHTSPVNNASKDTNFNQLPWEKQLSFISEELKKLGSGYAPHRANDLFEVLEIVDNPVNETSKTTGAEMVESMVKYPVIFNKLYPTIASNLFNEAEKKVLPPLTDLITLMNDLVQPVSYESFCKNAKALVERVEEAKDCRLYDLKWPSSSFVIPSLDTIYKSHEEMSAPWNAQVKWAVQALHENNEEPAKALILLGVEDPKLFQAMPEELLKKTFNGLITSKGIRDKDNEFESAALSAEFSTDSEVRPLFLTSAKMEHFNLSVHGDEVIIKPYNDNQPKWEPFEVILEAIRGPKPNDKKLETHGQQSVSNVKSNLSKPLSENYVYQSKLPFTDEAGFNKWFEKYKTNLTIPSILNVPDKYEGRFTTSETQAEIFQALMRSWYDKSPATRSEELQKYNQSSKGSGRYNADFYRVLTRQILPFEQKARQVTKMLHAQLEEGGEKGRELVRAFYLNPKDKPGLQQLLNQTEENKVLLHEKSSYIDFLITHPGLLSIKEKPAIISNIAFIDNPKWWEKFLEAPKVKDLSTINIFINKIQEFHYGIDELKLPGYELYDHRSLLIKMAAQKFSAILGYNYQGQYDISLLLENPPEVLEKINTKGSKGLSRNYDFDFLNSIEEVLSNDSKKIFRDWFIQNARPAAIEQSSKKIDVIENEKFLDIPGAIEMQFSYVYGNDNIAYKNLNKFFVSPPPSIPIKGTESIRDILAKHVKGQENWPENHTKLANIYRNIDELQLFPGPIWQKNFGSMVIESIKSENDLDARLKSLQILMGGDALKDPVVRQESTKLWIKTTHEKLKQMGLGKNGFDDDSDEYKKALLPGLKWAENHIPMGERYGLFVNLADKLQTQRSLSYSMRDSFLLTGRDFERSDSSFRIIEAVLIYACQKPESRKMFLDYFMGENDKESIDKISKWMRKERGPQPAALDWLGNDIKEKFDAVLSETTDLSYYRVQTNNLFNNFRTAPLPVRIEAFDKLLMTPEEKDYNWEKPTEGNKADSEAYTRAYNDVVEKLLPADIKYSKEARIALECFKNVQPPNERSLFLAALLAAKEASEKSEKLSVGERLAIVLEMMGPGEIKFGQGIGNYHGAPMDIRKPMIRLTKHAAQSTRWGMWERIEDVVPKKYMATFKRLGKISGSGSYQEGVETEKVDGTETILKWQRPYVEKRASAGYRRLRDFVQELQHNDAGLEENVAIAADRIVEQTEKMVSKETNVLYRRDQVKHAEGYYNPLEIAVADKKFIFQTASWLAYGVDRSEIPNRIDRKEWCEEVKKPGVHFDELAVNTEQQKQYKNAVAQAVIAAELTVLLSGRPIDHDRHAAQLKIQKKTNHIGLFDHGALDLDPPTLEEKQILAKLLVNVTQGYQSGGSLPDLFGKQLDMIKQEMGKVPDYLVKIERGLLAMTPFFEEISGDNLKSILSAVHSTGIIDKDILNTNLNIPMIGNIRFADALKFALPKETDIKININEIETSKEPLRFDYVYKNKPSTPEFPGLKKSNNKKNKDDQGSKQTNFAKPLENNIVNISTTEMSGKKKKFPGS